MAALLIGILGTLGTAGIGIASIGLTPLEVLWAVVASNLAGHLGLHLVVRVPSLPLGARLMAGAARTWLALSVTYLATLWAIAAPLRQWPIFPVMLFPLILSAFLQVPLFGWVQDEWVARRQRRERVL